MAIQTQDKTAVTYYITPEGRFSYLNAWRPRKKNPGEESKPDIYDGTIIMEMPKQMTADDRKRWNAIKQLCIDTAKTKWPKLKSPVQGPYRTCKGINDDIFTSKPLDSDKNPEYEGKLILKATSYGRQPQMLNLQKEEMMEQKELYSGCYGRFWVTAFAYENSGNRGVSLSLQGIMKTKDGSPLGGSAGKATEAFAEIEPDDTFDTEEDDEEEDMSDI